MWFSVEGRSNVESMHLEGAPPAAVDGASSKSSGGINLPTVLALALSAVNLLLVAVGATYVVRRRRQQQQVRGESRVAAESSGTASRGGMRSVGSTVRSFSSFASKFGSSQFSQNDNDSLGSLE